MTRKPINVASTGFQALLNKQGKPVQVTREGAQRVADRFARKSPIPNAVGCVWEGDIYFRCSVAGQPRNLRS